MFLSDPEIMGIYPVLGLFLTLAGPAWLIAMAGVRFLMMRLINFI